MSPDSSTGARLRALSEKLIPWLTHSDGCGALVPPYSYCSCGLNYAYHSALAAVAELDALLLVSESHQSEHIDADDLRAAGNACDAQGNIHDRQQLEEGHAGPPWRGREWHELAQKFIKASDHGQLVTESHPSDRLRELIEQLPRWGVRFKQNDLGSYFDGWNQEALGDWVKWSDVEALVRASQPSEGGGEMNGADLIRAERERQMAEEGWSASHDDCHRHGELARAAARYALEGLPVTGRPRWPWSRDWWKPKGRIKNLTRAGALIAAEIDRLQRCEPAPPSLVRVIAESAGKVCTCRHDSGLSTDCDVHYPGRVIAETTPERDKK